MWITLTLALLPPLGKMSSWWRPLFSSWILLSFSFTCWWHVQWTSFDDYGELCDSTSCAIQVEFEVVEPHFPGGTLQSFGQGSFVPSSYSFVCHFDREGTPFVFLWLKRCPFHNDTTGKRATLKFNPNNRHIPNSKRKQCNDQSKIETKEKSSRSYAQKTRRGQKGLVLTRS